MAVSGKATESGAASYIDNVTPTTLITNAQGANLILHIAKLLLINVSASAITIQAYKMASGGAISGDDWKFLKDFAMDAKETVDVREAAGMFLENGDSLRLLSSAASSLRFDLSYWAES